jgi:hypothetical protein
MYAGEGESVPRFRSLVNRIPRHFFSSWQSAGRCWKRDRRDPRKGGGAFRESHGGDEWRGRTGRPVQDFEHPECLALAILFMVDLLVMTFRHLDSCFFICLGPYLQLSDVIRGRNRGSNTSVLPRTRADICCYQDITTLGSEVVSPAGRIRATIGSTRR